MITGATISGRSGTTKRLVNLTSAVPQIRLRRTGSTKLSVQRFRSAMEDYPSPDHHPCAVSVTRPGLVSRIYRRPAMPASTFVPGQRSWYRASRSWSRRAARRSRRRSDTSSPRSTAPRSRTPPSRASSSRRTRSAPDRSRSPASQRCRTPRTPTRSAASRCATCSTRRRPTR
jgi:hypothetical protein